uniref:MFS transporter n=1 Tax=Mesocestoides corti TaxID=53468 RepID=A0A5K3F9N0_MESCO
MASANPLSVRVPMTREKGIQPTRDRHYKKRYIMSGIASIMNSDGWRITFSFGLLLIKKSCSGAPVFFMLGLGYSTLSRGHTFALLG